MSEGSGLWLPFFVTGLSIGFAWASLILITKEIFVFGGQHYGFLYTAGNLTPFVFVLTLFKGTYRYYEEQQEQQREIKNKMNNNNDVNNLNQHHQDAHHHSSCLGVECIAFPMIVCIILNVSAFITAVVLCRRIDRGCFEDEDQLTSIKNKGDVKVEEEIVKG